MNLKLTLSIILTLIICTVKSQIIAESDPSSIGKVHVKDKLDKLMNNLISENEAIVKSKQKMEKHYPEWENGFICLPNGDTIYGEVLIFVAPASTVNKILFRPNSNSNSKSKSKTVGYKADKVAFFKKGNKLYISKRIYDSTFIFLEMLTAIRTIF